MIGTTWESKQGTKTVMGVWHDGRWLVSLAGARTAEILSDAELHQIRALDTRNVESARLRAAQSAQAPVVTTLDNYLASIPDRLARGRARKTLCMLVRADGEYMQRRALIERNVTRGWTPGPLGLQAPNGAYLDRKAVTQTGLEYAAWLIAQTEAR